MPMPVYRQSAADTRARTQLPVKPSISMKSTVYEWKISCCGISAIHRKEVRSQVKYCVIYRHHCEIQFRSCVAFSVYHEADTMFKHKTMAVADDKQA